MPILIKTIDQIMDHEKRDLYFIQFGTDPFDFAEKRYVAAVRQHIKWFEQENYHMRLPFPAVGYGAIRDAVWSILTDPMILGSRSIQASSRTRQVEA